MQNILNYKLFLALKQQNFQVYCCITGIAASSSRISVSENSMLKVLLDVNPNPKAASPSVKEKSCPFSLLS